MERRASCTPRVRGSARDFQGKDFLGNPYQRLYAPAEPKEYILLYHGPAVLAKGRKNAPRRRRGQSGLFSRHYFTGRVVSALFGSFFRNIRLDAIPDGMPRHSPMAIPSIPFRTVTKAALQRIAMAIPGIRPVRRFLLFLFEFRISASTIKVPRFPDASPSTPAGAGGRRGPGRGGPSG